MLPNALAGASAEAMNIVESLKPFKGGNEVLWRIHALDIVDKHRIIVPVGAANSSLVVSTTMTVPWNPEPVQFPPFALKPADRDFPLKDGMEVFRIKAQARQPSIAQHKYQIQLEVAFGEGQIVNGENVLPVLASFVDTTQQTVDMFKNSIFPA
jgi:diadenosine tetraphosphatase ApaH/serine/threonine PP2A family protein phosphatase